MPWCSWYRVGGAVGVTALTVLAGCSAPESGPTAEAPAPRAATYTNPLLPSGPDPWITQVDGTYYYMHTLGDRIALWRTDNIARLAEATPVVVWTAARNGAQRSFHLGARAAPYRRQMVPLLLRDRERLQG